MMRQFNLKLTNVEKTAPTILIDGKPVRAKKNEFGNLTYSYQTEKDSVRLGIKRYLELGSPHWLWMGILFLIISVFGIFDSRYSKATQTLSFEVDIPLSDDVTNFEGKLSSKNEGVAVEYKCSSEVVEIQNQIQDNPQIKKRRKILLALRIVMIIVFVATLSGVLISKFIGG